LLSLNVNRVKELV